MGAPKASGALARHLRAAAAAAGWQGRRWSSSTSNGRADAGYSGRALAAAALIGAGCGAAAASEDGRLRRLELPASTFRMCCDEVPLTEAHGQLPGHLDEIVGQKHVQRGVTMKGAMSGKGYAMAVVSPGSLDEAVRVLRACVAADVAVLPQGANTGLTGGSVPREEECDRHTVVINMRRLRKIMPLGSDAEKVLCFAGAGIFELQEKLKVEHGRDSHSVLGSIFLNPSVGAGVSFGSGGTQIRKGPVYTERALYCRVDEAGNVELVNTLGLRDGGDAVSFLDGRESLSAEDADASCARPASWPRYPEHVTRFDTHVSRFNADTTGLECNRSEGKVLILASIHDTHPLPKSSKTVWVGCKDFATANALKRQVCLSSPQCMAKTCEYIERRQFDVIDMAGRLLIKMIEVVGMSNLGPFWNLKLKIESLPVPFAGVICDKVLWWFNDILPPSLPKPLLDIGREMDHNIIMEFSEYSDGEVARLEGLLAKFAMAQPLGAVRFHVCQDAHEASRAMLFRFAVQPSHRTYCVGKGLQGLIIDYAMPKSYPDFVPLPEKDFNIEKRLLCSHFGCNVYHESLVFGPEVDVKAAKKAIKAAIEASGGRLPAEHGHGTDYAAPLDTQQRWMAMDPTNAMNPGVGGLSYNKHYADVPCHVCQGCQAHK